jgi:hypothetical protein
VQAIIDREVWMNAEAKKLEVFQDLDLRGPEVGRSKLRKALLEYTVVPWRHADEIE